MTECIKKLYDENWPIETVPHPIDILNWRPIEKNLARKLNLPQNLKLIVFGAVGGKKDSRKGFELLELALKYLKNMIKSDEVNWYFWRKNQTYSRNKF